MRMKVLRVSNRSLRGPSRVDSRKRLRHSLVSGSVDVMIIGRRRVDLVNASDTILKHRATLHGLPSGV